MHRSRLCLKNGILCPYHRIRDSCRDWVMMVFIPPKHTEHVCWNWFNRSSPTVRDFIPSSSINSNLNHQWSLQDIEALHRIPRLYGQLGLQGLNMKGTRHSGKPSAEFCVQFALCQSMVRCWEKGMLSMPLTWKKKKKKTAASGSARAPVLRFQKTSVPSSPIE